MLWTTLALDGVGHLSASAHRAAAIILQGLLRQDPPSQRVPGNDRRPTAAVS